MRDSNGTNGAGGDSGGNEPPRVSHSMRGGASVTYEGRGATDDEPLPPRLAVPERLTAATRSAFRQTALEYLERHAGGAVTRAVMLDFRDTVEVDASGLGVLVHLRRRARDQGLDLRLANLPDAIRDLLTVTRLAPLFEASAE